MTVTSGTRHGSRPLSALLGALTDARLPSATAAGDIPITGVTADSRQVKPGHLFVAIRGARFDGHDAVPEVVAAGAAAVVAERAIPDAGVPVVRVSDSREALAELAAAWHGRPAERLTMVGITGTLGKTSILAMLASIMEAAGREIGTIGSLGVRFRGKTEQTGFTVPEPPVLQRAFARIADAGGELAAMEVTSHALTQARVHGLEFGLGIFTNLVPLEHAEYHDSFREYVRAKTLFFRYLRPGAPLIYAAGDRTVHSAVRERDVVPVGCGRGDDAVVMTGPLETRIEGTGLTLSVTRPLPRLGGGQVPPCDIPLELRIHGRTNVNNAALAAAAALCLGADPNSVRGALASLSPSRRRMEITRRGGLTVLDDTVGHPDSITAVFEVARALPHRRVHVVYAVRGQRGADINRRTSEALAVWAEKTPVASLTVTSSADTADDRNRVEPEERNAFLERLDRAGVPYREFERLDEAVSAALGEAGDGDLLLLLGAQGMDAGAEIVWGTLGSEEAGG